MPDYLADRERDYLADREREEQEHFVGIASDGLKWAVFELDDGDLVVVKRTALDPERAEEFLAWLEEALALKSSLPPDPLNIRAEFGHFSLGSDASSITVESPEDSFRCRTETPALGGATQARIRARNGKRQAVVSAHLPGDRREMYCARRNGPARGGSEKTSIRRSVLCGGNQWGGRKRFLRLGADRPARRGAGATDHEPRPPLPARGGRV